MSQAKRIKRQPIVENKDPAKKRNSNVPWGLVFVILISGVVLTSLLHGASKEDTAYSGWGSGLKHLFSNSNSTQSKDEEISDLIENQAIKNDFDFYDVLPEIEQIMPDKSEFVQSSSAKNKPKKNLDYYLQAASFRKHADAEILRSRLTSKGFKSITQAREVANKGTFYRVRLGPYSTKRKAQKDKNKLQSLGVSPLIYSMEKQ